MKARLEEAGYNPEEYSGHSLRSGFVEAFSNSNLDFPASAGNEAAVRFGANDSLTNNFTAGDYPGLGNRNIAADGYRVNVALSTVG